MEKVEWQVYATLWRSSSFEYGWIFFLRIAEIFTFSIGWVHIPRHLHVPNNSVLYVYIFYCYKIVRIYVSDKDFFERKGTV